MTVSETTLPDIPGGWTERQFDIAGRAFTLILPANPDAFLDDPVVHARHDQDGYMPYWSYLWPTSLETAAAVLRSTWTPGTQALEIGAGTGLTGLAGLAMGLEVTFSDYDALSVDLCLLNARRNGFENGQGLVLDWRKPVDRKFAIIFGCDVIYEQPNHGPILGLLHNMLAPQGECWLSDPGRHQSDAFIDLARSEGIVVTGHPVQREPFRGRPDGVTTIWKLRRND